MYLVSVISIYLTPVTLSASLVSAPPLSSLPVTKVTSTTITWEANTKHNPASSIVEGIISPERFTKMTSQEVASEERKVGDNKIEEENLFEPLAAAEQQAEISTDAFQCLRCKQRKCVYYQLQTRSADEPPPTTFVTCTVCQNKWKFS